MSPDPVLLIVDDDQSNRESYAMAFGREPYELITADGGQAAIKTLSERPVDIILTDLKMPDVDGLEVVKAAASRPSPPSIIVLTAYGTIETAVEAMRLGAFDYLTKPINLKELRAKIEKSLEFRQLRTRNEQLEGMISERFKFEGVVGSSDAMREVIDQAKTVAPSKASVLIEGESGTGKELIARAIHFNSHRANGAFVPIHCAAIPEQLLEAELFGAEKGAYTGSVSRRIGHFESAEGGTVFLDEIGEIPLGMQVKLLRVIEQREITRVGANIPIPIDIRLVAATNKNLQQQVQSGKFREDLYYRLNVVRIELPALRQRPEDIPPLVHHFMKMIANENKSTCPEITQEALNVLMHYPWKGNIRELRNIIEQTLIFAHTDRITPQELPAQIKDAVDIPTAAAHAPAAAGPGIGDPGLKLDDLERRHIIGTLEALDGNRTHAAKRLGISRRTLQRKLHEFGADEHGEEE